jgi:hypothetical protein
VAPTMPLFFTSFSPRCPGTVILPISASQVTRITGARLWHPSSKFSLQGKKHRKGLHLHTLAGFKVILQFTFLELSVLEFYIIPLKK